MHRMFAMAVLCLCLLLSACAVAPLTRGGPARAVGEGNWEGGLVWAAYTTDRGTVALAPSGKLRSGLTPHSSLSVWSEFRTLTLAFENQYFASDRQSFFAGWEGGFSYAAGAASYSLGHTVSWRCGDWEPYFNFGVSLANLEPGAYDSRFFRTIPSLHAVLFTAALGTRWQATEWLALGGRLNAAGGTGGWNLTAPLYPTADVSLSW